MAPATQQPPECGESDCPSGTVPGVHGPHSEQAEASGAHEMERGRHAEEDARVGECEAPEGLLRVRVRVRVTLTLTLTLT